ncbi:MAG TPA: hypothetical protein VFB13_16015 [Reyranella sp.]|jgi:opacity protein-like surface antigen|nr:hypothetical protein [Reyranella sp.]
MKILTVAALSAAVAMAGIGGARAADLSVTFDPGTVAYGYTDGYWSTDHHWHKWEKPEYVEMYRHHPGARYYEYRHDRDRDMGWRGDVVIHH